MSQDTTTRPANLRADAMPIDGYILSVDRKLKTRYESLADAMMAGSALKQAFPVIQIAIYDAAQKLYTPVELREEQ
jgi:hypothetical protein